MFKYTFAVFAFTLFCVVTAHAQCSCSKPDIPALEEFKVATIVLTGEIIDIQKTQADDQGRHYETVKIAVAQVWKQNVDSIITIKNYVYGCTQGWKKGDKYLVYAFLNDDGTTYSTRCCCSRTANLEKGENDVADFFNAGYALSHVRVSRKDKFVIAGWMNSRAVNFQIPQYPSAIKKPRSAARVDVRITTDVDGNVESAEVVRGPFEFHGVALEAARKLKFTPTLLSGVPTKVTGWISFDFKP